MKTNHMMKTQVYLYKEQDTALKALIKLSGKTQSELLREAIDLLLANHTPQHNRWKESLMKMKGMWKDDEEAVQRMKDIRSEFDR